VNHDYAGARAFAAHALSPLAAISKSEIDIVWLHFDAAPERDLAVLQETSTLQNTLNYGRVAGASFTRLRFRTLLPSTNSSCQYGRHHHFPRRFGVGTADPGVGGEKQWHP
jgi:hypothetical protein